MSSLIELMQPLNEEEKAEFALEALVLSIQLTLQKVMQKKGISKKELARRMGVSKARVSQIFSGGPTNVNLKTIARVASALDEDFEFVERDLLERDNSTARYCDSGPATRIRRTKKNELWRDTTANENRLPIGMAVA